MFLRYFKLNTFKFGNPLSKPKSNRLTEVRSIASLKFYMKNIQTGSRRAEQASKNKSRRSPSGYIGLAGPHRGRTKNKADADDWRWPYASAPSGACDTSRGRRRCRRSGYGRPVADRPLGLRQPADASTRQDAASGPPLSLVALPYPGERRCRGLSFFSIQFNYHFLLLNPIASLGPLPYPKTAFIPISIR